MSALAQSVPVCEIDFYGAASIEDPVNAYHQMLDLGPVVWLAQNKLHAICGHSAVVAALRNHEGLRSGYGVSINEAVNKMLVGSTLNSDPPLHDKTRKITFAPLAPKNMQQVKEKVETEAKRIVEQMLGQPSFDAASEFAPQLPLSIVRDLVGLGDYGKEKMLDWGAATFELMGDPKERRSAATKKLKGLRTFLTDPATLDKLNDDGWAKRATQMGIDSGMDPAAAAELMRDYIAPSLDTTISAIGYGIKLFAENPEQWAMIRKKRDLVHNAIEEIVRLNSPIRAFSRVVANDTDIAGVMLEQGSRVLIVFGAANRDRLRFARPDEFDIKRKTIGHVGFGQGVHACLGMNLARLEMSSLFNALADRVERFELTGPIVQSTSSTIHSLSSVPVKAILS